MRARKGISQRQLAQLADISNTEVARIESGERKNPSNEVLEKIAKALHIPFSGLLSAAGFDVLPPGAFPVGPQVRIPVLGVIRAGVPILAEEHIEGHDFIDAELAKTGEFFFLRVTGDSMTGSRIHPGDLVLVRKQEDVDDGQIAVVIVDGENATIKKIYRDNGSLILQPTNPAYKPMVLDRGEVRIIGRVVKVSFDTP